MCDKETNHETGKPAKLPLPEENKIANILRRLLIAWLTGVALEFMLLPAESRSLVTLDALKGMSLLRILLLTGIISNVLALLSPLPRWHNIEKWCLPLSFSLLAGLTLQNSYTLPYFCVCLLILLVLIGYAGADYLKRIRIRTKRPLRLQFCFSFT